MGEVQHLSDHRRELIADGRRSTLRATWHNEAGYIVLSLWRDNLCVATSHLTPREAARLATFITGGLADLAEEGGHLQAPAAERRRRLLHLPVSSWRLSLGTALERLARRLRTSQ